jgi:hypothetical protein
MLTRIHRDYLVLCAAFLCLSACNSDQEDVCDNVGACAQAGSSDWIRGCKDEAKLLQKEASSDGCAGLFDDYYACANASFTCEGATPEFPGCDAKRAALESCISGAEATNACGALVARTQACASSDAGSDAEGGTSLAPACTIQRVCQAQCYLDHVSNACAPAVNELSDLTTCAASCPP